MVLRSLSFAAALATLSLASVTVTGCSGSSAGSEEPEAEAAEGALTLKACSRPRTPGALSELEDMEACKLQALFEDPESRRLTQKHGLLSGAYDGVPLCRKEVLRQVERKAIPPNVSRLGVGAILKLLSISDRFDNAVAGEIWHGKHFTPDQGPAPTEGDVNNYIDILDRSIQADTRRSAEARYFIDPQHDWLVLNYKNASTGLRGLKHFSVELIRQVYDTARLVNAEKGIYVGMAWMVNEPGTFNQADEASYIPSCYFALQKKTDVPADDKANTPQENPGGG